MADNYLEFSEQIDDLTDEEVAWWEAEILRINSVQEQITNGEIEDPEDDSLCHDFDFDADKRRVWFHPDESGNPSAVANVVHRFLKETGRQDCFWLTWAEHCSKPALGEFGGGAVFVTAETIEWHTTEEWLQDKQIEFEGRGQFPRVNLSFSGWSRNVEVTTAHDLKDGVPISLTGVSSDELASKVNHGVWAIALSKCLGQSTKEEIEITDVEASR